MTPSKLDRLTTEDEDFEFNNMETDERINMEIVKFDMNFPDPLQYCIGVFTKTLSQSVYY